MLVLFETPAGYSLFKLSNDKKLAQTSVDDIHDVFFSDSITTKQNIQLVSFQPFRDTADAVSNCTSLMEGNMNKSLSKFLKKQLKKGQDSSMLAVCDKSLASSIKTKFGDCIIHDSKTHELYRGIRQYLDELLLSENKDECALSSNDMRAMQLGLSHQLSRYKLKFSSDKVDTMVIQAVNLLDELDKEINTYAMRTKEWYGWHFPELTSIVNDSKQYAMLVLQCGVRTNFRESDLSSILTEERVEQSVKEAAEVSMGTEIAELDILNIKALAEQVLSLTEYRAQLFEYLRNRMNAIAPNLTILVGELVGARLISHAGSLMNLAKQPASTVQILGAEKALFRALKTKHDTPKYGLIYHASLIGQAAPKNKGKISRVLAAKAALAIRVDALSDDVEQDTTIGFEGRSKVEARLRQLEGGGMLNTTTNLGGSKIQKYDATVAKASATAPDYNAASDMVLDTTTGAAASSSSSGGDKKKKEKKEKKKKKKSEKKKRKADELDGGDDEDEEEESPEAKAARKAAKRARKEKKKSKES